MAWVQEKLDIIKCPKKISNLGSDLSDSIGFVYLLNQLDPKNCSLEPLEKEDLLERAELVIENSKHICAKPPVIAPKDILEGNHKANLVFIEQLFSDALDS